MKVEKPDPTNHTDARNPSTHAEEKGLYRLSFICFSKHLDIYSIKSIFLMSLKILEVLKISTVFNLSCYALEVWTVLEFAPYDLVFYRHHWFSNCGTWPPPCGYLWRNVQIYILYCQDTTQCVMKINNKSSYICYELRCWAEVIGLKTQAIVAPNGKCWKAKYQLLHQTSCGSIDNKYSANAAARFSEVVCNVTVFDSILACLLRKLV